jgi:crossover junction endodeoxyribonuclease RuvC
MGYGLIESVDGNLRMLDCGVLTAPSKMPPTDRLYRLYKKLLELVARYHPDELAVEEPFVARNVRSALAIGRAQALAILAAVDNGIPVYTYAPTKVKQTITGYGASGKEQVQQMVKIQLELPEVLRSSDAADALAIAICHFRERHIARLIVKGE